MGAFLKVLGADARSIVPWVLWITLSFAVAITGPFGSYGAFGLSERAMFWSPVLGLSILIGSMVRAFVYGTLGRSGTLFGTLLITGLNCAVLCPLLFVVFEAMLPPAFFGASHMVEIVLLVSSISLGICALRQVQPFELVEVKPAEAKEPDPPPPRLMRRIEPELRGPILAISVRDHYVDVQTAVGKASILMRFSDAIDEVDCVPGAQVHRSHWVAWQGVDSVCREGGKVILHLRNGQQIPVSRNNRDKVDAQFPPGPALKDVAA